MSNASKLTHVFRILKMNRKRLAQKYQMTLLKIKNDTVRVYVNYKHTFSSLD